MGNRAILGTYNEAWGPSNWHKGVHGYCFMQKKLSFILLPPQNGWELISNGEKIHIRGRWGVGAIRADYGQNSGFTHCGTHCNPPLQGDDVRKRKMTRS